MKKGKHRHSVRKQRKVSGNSSVKLSSAEIERLYELEKKKIENSSLHLEEERLNAYLRMMDKRKVLLKEKLGSLKKVENSLSRQADEALKKVADLKGMKSKEKKHFDLLYLLNEQLKDIENQTKKVIIFRKEMLNHEKRLFSTARQSLNKNRGELKYDGGPGVKEIDKVLNKKRDILENTASLLDKDLAILFKDKKILERITDVQLNQLSEINLKLKKASEEQNSLLKKLQRLKAEHFGYGQAFTGLNYKRQKFLSDLQDLKRRFRKKSKTKL